MSKIILFLDDQQFYCQRYIESLEEEGFTVHYCGSPSEASALLDGTTEYEALVLDVMMPRPVDSTDDDDSEGIDENDTGLWFLKKILPIVVARPLPVVILTNRNLEIVKAFVAELKGGKPGLIDIRFKADTSNTFLPKLVQKQIGIWRKR